MEAVTDVTAGQEKGELEEPQRDGVIIKKMEGGRGRTSYK